MNKTQIDYPISRNPWEVIFPALVQNETSSVRIVAAKSYEEDVHTAVKDAIVFFHAPW